jgi:hypothetical protein
MLYVLEKSGWNRSSILPFLGVFGRKEFGTFVAHAIYSGIMISRIIKSTLPT